ncbi:hypothetical protein SODALDRAFT_382401 [Sodiomyces alkalinus F11]|uniref:Uncharacterized protein n=1 Tax=Sodiomyces alkalinus (strain CBS 110278 / VKM F-3762 / F11) TaxID=1314773 RepID=A0A3N2PJP8_SODAK|nr:hypothetical protein SODALDRAFT_382401 [Sodiomyces alkalinus F11]ROT34604.1 hypothetical protein SODALDRAFT_382401 [Sodiomyces alkalinus F11]
MPSGRARRGHAPGVVVPVISTLWQVGGDANLAAVGGGVCSWVVLNADFESETLDSQPVSEHNHPTALNFMRAAPGLYLPNLPLYPQGVRPYFPQSSPAFPQYPPCWTVCTSTRQIDLLEVRPIEELSTGVPTAQISSHEEIYVLKHIERKLYMAQDSEALEKELQVLEKVGQNNIVKLVASVVPRSYDNSYRREEHKLIQQNQPKDIFVALTRARSLLEDHNGVPQAQGLQCIRTMTSDIGKDRMGSK